MSGNHVGPGRVYWAGPGPGECSLPGAQQTNLKLFLLFWIAYHFLHRVDTSMMNSGSITLSVGPLPIGKQPQGDSIS